jgi:hypothetical protein
MSEFQLRILGKTWNCRLIDQLPGQNFVGMFIPDRCEILLVKGQDPEQQADTLLHEALHAIDYTLRLELSEQQIHALAAALYALVADNPDLLNYLQVTQDVEVALA